MAAPSHRNTVETSNSTASTTLTVTMPTFQVGDCVIVVIAGTLSADPAGTHSSNGGAFTEIGTQQNITSVSAVRLSLWYRIMQSGDSSSYSWTATDSQGFHAIATSYYDVDQSDPINATDYYLNSTATTTITIPSVTTDEDDCMVVHVCAQDDQEAKTGYTGTERMTWNSATTGISTPGNGTNCALGDRVQATAGATGAESITILSEENCGMTVALNPVLGLYASDTLDIKYDVEANKIEGVTYDSAGSVLTSCDVFLLKDNGDNTLSFMGHTTSHATTGAYGFYGIPGQDAAYIVIAWKDNTPHVFDCTDHVLQPEAE